MIIKKVLRPIDIDFLHDKNALYVSDFRAIGESMDYEIPAMWKYENLLPWIVNSQNIIVNEDNKKLAFPSHNNLITIPKASSPKISIFERLEKQNIDPKISKLWVAVPHPKADKFAQQRNLVINYRYDDLLKRNDKFEQKKLLAKLTPKWKIIQEQNNLLSISKNNQNGFIKRRHGSGGFTVLNSTNVVENEKDLLLFRNNPSDWYFEQFVPGKSYSIQCIKNMGNEIEVFGFSEQQIVENKYFVGSQILDLNNLSGKIFDQLKQGIKRLSSLLKNYEGFFGLDFIVNKSKTYILEADIRLTSVTVPTLLANARGVKRAIYMENVKSSNIQTNDIVLTYDTFASQADILKLLP